ncbi:MAG: DUF86 domain-containing protein [Chitinophagales bacterium]
MKRNTSYPPEEILGHILDEIKILSELKKQLSEKQFYKDEFLKRTAVRCFEIIGEATKKLPIEFRKSNAQINWKEMAGMRDFLIHDYLEVNYKIVWDTMKEDIPELEKQIKNLKKKLKHG